MQLAVGTQISLAYWNITSVVTSNSLSNDIVAVDDAGQWLSVWVNEDLNVVQGVLGASPINQITSIVTVLPYACGDPIVVDNTLVCFNTSNSAVVVAKLTVDGVAIEARSIGSFGYGFVGHVMRGSRQNITVLGLINQKNTVCLHLKSIQYPLYTLPLCWTETDGAVDSLVLTSLTNDSIVVAYFVIGFSQSTIKTQMINMVCGDGFVGPNEECDSVPNCDADCRCANGYNFDPNNNNCIFNPSTPMPPSPEVLPLLDCFVPLNGTHVRGYFLYNNLQNQSVLVLIGPDNYFTTIGADVGQPTIFSPGRVSFFPASAFAVTWSKQAIEWHLTSNLLALDPASSAQLCPTSKTFVSFIRCLTVI